MYMYVPVRKRSALAFFTTEAPAPAHMATRLMLLWRVWLGDMANRTLLPKRSLMREEDGKGMFG